MKKFTRYFIIAGILLCGQLVMAQSGFYVPKAGKIFFNGDTATIFSDVINQGKLGVGKNAFVNFSGRVWGKRPFVADHR